MSFEDEAKIVIEYAQLMMLSSGGATKKTNQQILEETNEILRSINEEHLDCSKVPSFSILIMNLRKLGGF